MGQPPGAGQYPPLQLQVPPKVVEARYAARRISLQGLGNTFKYKIASFRDRPERNNHALHKLVAYSRELLIPLTFPRLLHQGQRS